MLSKIVSGGQTGVDRAALDMAIELDIEHGGWVPKGRLAEDGPLSEKYRLKEMPTERYAARTEQNVIDSDGTLIIARGNLRGGSAYTRKMAMKHGKPWCFVDLDKTAAFQAALDINDWLEKQNIAVLNVAGPRASEALNLYSPVKKLLESVYLLNIGQHAQRTPRQQDPWRLSARPPSPACVADVVENVLAAMSLKDKIMLANMHSQDLFSLDASIGAYLTQQLKIWSADGTLWRDIKTQAAKEEMDTAESVEFLIRQIWQTARETHKLRRVK